MRPVTDVDLLPHLVQVARKARLDAKLTYAHIAVHVQKGDGRTGVAESTVLRFENGRAWPANPDAMIRAYAAAIGCGVGELWAEAARGLLVLDEAHDFGSGPDRRGRRKRRVADRALR
jgi:hypothetical protein